MKQAAFSALQNYLSYSSILIIDKKGIIGVSILHKIVNLSKHQKVIIVSEKKLVDEGLGDIKFVPYKKRISSIPLEDYSLIFIVCNGEREILDVIWQFQKKVQESKGKLFLILPFELINKNIREKIESLRSTILVFLGEVFGNSSFDSKPNEYLYKLKKEGKIDIYDQGLGVLYPVFYEDAISKIVEIAFEKQLNSQIFYLFQKQEVTELSFARLLKKIDPMVKIDFTKKDRNGKKSYDIKEGEYVFDNNYPLEDRLKKALEELDLKKDFIQIKNSDTSKKNNYFNKIRFLLLTLFLFLILPFFLTILFSLFGALELKIAKEKIEKADFSNAKISSNLAKTFFDLSLESGKMLSVEASIIGKENYTLKLIKNTNVGKEISVAIFNLLNSTENLVKVFSGKSISPKDDFVSATNSVKNAIVVFQKIKTDKDTDFLNVSFENQSFKNLIQIVSSTIDILPNIFGFEGQRSYLVLLQNNMELRPGGGFIGSYGLLTLNRGRIVDFSIRDVYEADGQLKGHVEPPFTIRRYIPLVHSYLRDSNFSPDFTKNASSAAFLLNQETKDVVDGVIGVDVSFVKNLLSVLGPIKVSDYNEIVTSDNLYMLTQSHAEKNFFPGSTQKKDFLRSLFNAIQQNVFPRKDLPYLKISEVLGNSISQKHILLSFTDPKIQSVFTINGMSSSLWDSRKNSEALINDFLGVNEANLGVNKANYFIKRKVNQEVLIDDKGEISEKLTIDYTNDSKAWPGGDYKNYLRLILPLGTKLSSILIDGKEQQIEPAVTDFQIYEAKNFKPPKELEIEESQESEKTIFGFLVIVPTGGSKKITISYTLSQKILPETSYFNYSNWVFKQPGTEEDPFSFSLTYPESLKVFNLPKDLRNSNNQISFSKKLTTDINFEIGFSRR